MKKHKSSKSSKPVQADSTRSSPEVLVLPPELLVKLGIDLGNNPNLGEPAFDTSHPQGFNHNIKSPSSSLSETKDASSSIIETANLMKESVFLSPTFLQPGSNIITDDEEPITVKRVTRNYTVTNGSFLNTCRGNKSICEAVTPKLLNNDVVTNPNSEEANLINENEVKNQDGDFITDVLFSNQLGTNNRTSSDTLDDKHTNEAYFSDFSNGHLRSVSESIQTEVIKKKLKNKIVRKSEELENQLQLIESQDQYSPVVNNASDTYKGFHSDSHITKNDQSFVIVSPKLSITDEAVQISSNENITRDSLSKKCAENIIPVTLSVKKASETQLVERITDNVKNKKRSKPQELKDHSKLIELNDLLSPVVMNSIIIEKEINHDLCIATHDIEDEIDSLHEKITDQSVIKTSHLKKGNVKVLENYIELPPQNVPSHVTINRKKCEMEVDNTDLDIDDDSTSQSSDVNISSMIEKHHNIRIDNANQSKASVTDEKLKIRSKDDVSSGINCESVMSVPISESIDSSQKNIISTESSENNEKKHKGKKSHIYSENKTDSQNRVEDVEDLRQVTNERKIYFNNNNNKEEIISETKVDPNKSKLRIHGVEKPGGNLMQNHIILRIEKNKIKTYERTIKKRKLPAQITKRNEQITSDTFQLSDRDESQGIPAEALLDQNKFCICYDFGYLAYYDCEMLYEHIHFWHQNNISCEPEIIFSIYNENDESFPKQIVDFIEDGPQYPHDDVKFTQEAICWNDMISLKSEEIVKSALNDSKITKEASFSSGEKPLRKSLRKKSLLASELEEKKAKEDFNNTVKIIPTRKRSSAVLDHVSNHEPHDKKKVKCGVCNQLLSDNEWETHKKTEHNFIAWKAGQEIDIQNKTFLETLRQTYKNVGFLTCPICKRDIKNMMPFTKHVKKCIKLKETNTVTSSEATVSATHAKKSTRNSTNSKTVESLVPTKSKASTPENATVLSKSSTYKDTDGCRTTRRSSRIETDILKSSRDSKKDSISNESLNESTIIKKYVPKQSTRRKSKAELPTEKGLNSVDTGSDVIPRLTRRLSKLENVDSSVAFTPSKTDNIAHSPVSRMSKITDKESASILIKNTSSILDPPIMTVMPVMIDKCLASECAKSSQSKIEINCLSEAAINQNLSPPAESNKKSPRFTRRSSKSTNVSIDSSQNFESNDLNITVKQNITDTNTSPQNITLARRNDNYSTKAHLNTKSASINSSNRNSENLEIGTENKINARNDKLSRKKCSKFNVGSPSSSKKPIEDKINELSLDSLQYNTDFTATENTINSESGETSDNKYSVIRKVSPSSAKANENKKIDLGSDSLPKHTELSNDVKSKYSNRRASNTKISTSKHITNLTTIAKTTVTNAEEPLKDAEKNTNLSLLVDINTNPNLEDAMKSLKQSSLPTEESTSKSTKTHIYTDKLQKNISSDTLETPEMSLNTSNAISPITTEASSDTLANIIFPNPLEFDKRTKIESGTQQANGFSNTDSILETLGALTNYNNLDTRTKKNEQNEDNDEQAVYTVIEIMDESITSQHKPDITNDKVGTNNPTTYYVPLLNSNTELEPSKPTKKYPNKNHDGVSKQMKNEVEPSCAVSKSTPMLEITLNDSTQTDTSSINDSEVIAADSTHDVNIEISLQTSDKLSTCGVCAESVEHEQWIDHIYKNHNYIAWRQSEPILDVKDIEAVKRHLQDISKENNGLKCSNCGLVRKFAKAFLNHVENCCGDEQEAAKKNKSTSDDLDSTKEFDDESPLHLLKSKKRKSASHPPVVCGVCSQTVQLTAWYKHIRKKHNYLAWRVGENPIDLNDDKQVWNHLNYISKYYGGLFCSKCGAKWIYVKKYLAHEASCVGEEIVTTKTPQTEKIEIEIRPFVICGVCKMKVEGKVWIDHIQQEHQYLAWIDGEDPLDLNNSEQVKEHLQKISKMAGGLTCHLCGVSRCHEAGYTLHMKACTSTGFKMERIEPTVEKGQFECGVCHEKGNRKEWKTHVMTQHYNIGWMVGEIPINLRNPYAVERYLKEYKRKNNLICKTCKATRTSCYGFYAHIMTCGKSEAELDAVHDFCNICNNKYLCIYKSQHLAMHRDQEARRKKREMLALMEAEGVEFIEKEPPRPEEIMGKRKAAKKAKKVIEKFTSNGKNVCGCGAIFLNVEEKTAHECVQKQQTEDDDTDVSVKMEPGEEESSDSDIDSDVSNEELQLKKKKRIRDGPSRVMRLSCKVNNYRAFLHNGYRDFCNLHFTSDILFNMWRDSPYDVVTKEEVDQYIPSLTESCKVRFGNKNDHDWSTYKRFESKKVMGFSLFTGGAIQCMSWVPHNIADETLGNYLAVAVHHGPDLPRYGPEELPEHPGLLQIWNFKQFNFLPKCSLGLAHDYGVIWSMDWCPSGARDLLPNGCSDDYIPTYRLGLLAIACSNGTAYILAVPYPSEFEADEPFLFKLKPVAELRLSMSLERRIYQATSIMWSQQKGHNIIVVGYSDGTTALYDLNTESRFLKTDENNVTVYYPFQDKHAENSSIAGVGILPTTNESYSIGGQFSASITGGTMSTWPATLPAIRSNLPISSCFYSPLWPGVLLAGDSQFTNKAVTEMEWWGGGRRMGSTRSGAACARCGRLCAAAAPAVRLLRAHPCYPEVKKQLVATILMVPFGQKRKRKANDDLSVVVEPLTYEDAVAKYGLQFSLVPKNEQMEAHKLCHGNEPSPEQFPLSEIVAVAFCPSTRFHEKITLATHTGLIFVMNAP